MAAILLVTAIEKDTISMKYSFMEYRCTSH